MSAHALMGRGVFAERGFSLIVVLLLLVIVTVLGIGAAQLALVNERSARNDRDSEIALQAADAALMDAELDVLGPNQAASARLCLFNDKDVAPFVAGCGGAGSSLGLCAPNEPGTTPAWMQADLSPTSKTAVEYGTFTGQKYVTGQGATPAALPRYIVEVIRNNGGWQAMRLESASAGNATNIFRVTAIGFGVGKETQVVLQTNLYKPTVSAGCP
ncbi:PilX N-terminal domain-containing pilus assembly protein [Variovorax sp. J22G47]|uniref:pilus assembly PilX family protein n=1 Tax=Variovorax fucosicus TaxID=3053517 RepID=UPI002574976E|nr:PilX N-terminal domain-containing pilus assembly protein [Variovorax sp. J22G47]MDM0057122.1 PilX N-terminal domain-containing pilus assembly protein [Variovorax sp. J22G47]